MKEIKTERTVYDIHYEAVDGTVFYDKEECEKYDGSAKAVIRQNFKKLIVKEGNEYSFFNVGSDEAIVYAVKIESAADANTVKQLWELDHEYLQETSNYEERQQRAYAPIDKAYNGKDILFVGEDCEGEIYIIDSRANIIEDLQKIGCEKDIKKKE